MCYADVVHTIYLNILIEQPSYHIALNYDPVIYFFITNFTQPQNKAGIY